MNSSTSSGRSAAGHRIRWPIRNQILLPLISIQLLVIVGTTCLGTWFSLRQVEQQVQNRFDELTDTVQRSTFPLTNAVLEQLRGLSGAEFVLQDDTGRVLSTTFEPAEVVEFERNQTARDRALARQAEAVRDTFLLKIRDRQFRAVQVPATLQQQSVEVTILYPQEMVQSARREAVLIPVVLGIVTLVLTTIAVILVAHHIGRRIHAVERQVAHIAQGHFAQIPLRSRNDEIRDLSESVNLMTQRLEEMTGHIRATERAQLLKQVAGGIAHQLRNSLTGARLAMQLHRRRCERSEDESLSVALRQLVMTEEQIRGLVALIRDEHRPRVPGSLHAMSQEVAALVQPMCEHRQIRFEMTGDPQAIQLSDADQMRAALLNLCINAIEATANGGAVGVHLQVDGRQVTIDVSDDGPGVPEDAVDQIFDPFHTSKPDGMGLGLALVRQTAEDHAGTVNYFRQHGKSVFRFTFLGDRFGKEFHESHSGS